jgi:hypothetical protein
LCSKVHFIPLLMCVYTYTNLDHQGEAHVT